MSGGPPIVDVWARLIHTVADSPAALASGPEHDDVAIAEGYDYWAQVLTFGLRRELHYGDVRHPMFHRIGLDTKIGFDNPDNVYEIARIDPARAYRVHGSRGTAHFLEFSTSVGFPGVVVPPKTVSKLDTSELDVGNDGSIEVMVGGPPRQGNWLATDDEVTSVLVRQVFGDWRADDVPGDFRIEPLDGSDGERGAVLATAELSQRLARTAEFVETQTRYWLEYIEQLAARIQPNTFETPGLQGRELVQVNAARAFFTWGLFQLARDEALVVEIPAPPRGAYLGFHLVNYWLQSLDFVGRLTSCNNLQAHTSGDGTIRYVLAHDDPQVPNWMDVGGHPWGGMLFRAALMPEASQPTATLVPFDELRDVLPADTPIIRAATRQEQLRVRRAHVGLEVPLVTIDAEELLDRAAEATGLDDFGPMAFREGLVMLLDSADREARMHDAGHELLAGMIRSRLINRLQLYDWHRRHPEIGQEEIQAPVFVIGLWRTGTTILSYVLAQDPDNRSLRRWEASIPCPPPGLDLEADRDRISRLGTQIARQVKATPELAAINIQEAEGPTECVLTLSHEFKSLLFDCSLHVPSFYEWNRSVDQVSAYELHRSTLQLLQWKSPPKRWQLKAPAHTLSLPALLEVYPDARFIVPHRDPSVSLASACDFWELQMQAFSEKVDTDALGAHWLDVYCDALECLRVFLDEQVDPRRVVELQYADLRDTLAAVGWIYDALGIPMTDNAERRMADFLANHRPGQHGKHEYSLERYGLDPAEVAGRFAPWVERFEIDVP